MMKIFRSMRIKLVNDRSVKKYFIYAIGEIFLVFIGILLALQVNNWNQNRIYASKELNALTDLKKEFLLNKDRISKKQNLRVSIVPRLENYIKLISTGTADYTSFKELNASPILFGMTNPSNGVIGALISSGEIALISNDSLKYYLADWKNQAENLYENEQILWNSGLEYFKSSSVKIPNPSHIWADWDQNKLKIKFKDLVTDNVYRNSLTSFEGANKVVIEECNTTLLLLDKVLNLLDSEINNHK